MIFYGWNHVKAKILGIYRDSFCEVCAESLEYKLIIRRTYFTLFFVPILCYKTEYIRKCVNCPSKALLSKEEANDILDRYIPEGKRKLLTGRIIRFCLFALVAGLFAIFMIEANNREKTEAKTGSSSELNINELKDMIEEEGEYLIYKSDGDIVADITFSEEGKKANYYYMYYPFTDNVPIGHEYECIYYYYEREKGELDYVENPAMIITDDNFVGFRYHYYDTYEDEIFWYYGVEDLYDIEYGEDRVVYPMKQFTGNGDVEYYSKIRIGGEGSHAVLTFYHGTNTKDTDTLTRLDIILVDKENNSENWMRYYQSLDLPIDSTFSEIISFIEENNLSYDERDYKEFYLETTGVISQRIYEVIENGVEYKDEFSYLITKKDNGYYIGKLIQ